MPISTNTPPAPERISRRAARSSGKVQPRLDVQVAQSTVRFLLDVRNVGTKHVELDFASGQTYDFVVVDSLGGEVWRWSKGRLFTQGIQNKQLSHDEAMQAREIWKRPAPGRYTAIATLRSTNFPVEERADFVVH